MLFRSEEMEGGGDKMAWVPGEVKWMIEAPREQLKRIKQQTEEREERRIDGD